MYSAPVRAKRVVSGLLLTPGAGADRDQPALVAVDQAASSLGLSVERIDFPYRLAGRKRPDAAPVLVDTVVSATHALAARVGVGTDSILLGGRSMGGRICSMAALWSG